MRKSLPRSLPSLSIRIDLDQGRIGPGKVQLLENIRSCGSIFAAGRAMNMSYRRAWGLVDEINRICKRTAVQRWEGGVCCRLRLVDLVQARASLPCLKQLPTIECHC